MRKHVDLIPEILNDQPKNQLGDAGAIGFTLQWLDDHPAVAERTLTRSQMRELINEHFHTRVKESDVEAYTESLGKFVVIDTNAELIEKALRQCNYAGGPEYIAAQLDALGVKAPEQPGIDDEQ